MICLKSPHVRMMLAAFAAAFVLSACGGGDAAAGVSDDASESLKEDLGIWSGDFESSENDGYIYYTTAFGLGYELPEYWIHSIESTDTEVYDYRNSVLDPDGSMVIAYISNDDLDGTDLQALADMFAEELEAAYVTAGISIGDFAAEKVGGTAIHVSQAEADYGTAHIDMYLMEFGDGVVTVTFNRLEDSDYDAEFQDILESMEAAGEE